MVVARFGKMTVRPLIRQEEQVGWITVTSDDGVITWKDAADHTRFWETSYDSFEAFKAWFPVVEFEYFWPDPVPDAVGLTEASDTNRWGEYWEYLDSPGYYFEADAIAYLDGYGYTENQSTAGGPEGVADFTAYGERRRYYLRRWNNPTVRFAFEDDTEHGVDFELVDGDGATVRSATANVHLSQSITVSQDFPDAAGNEIVLRAGSATVIGSATELLICSPLPTGDYDGAAASPGVDGFPTWPNDYTAFWAATDTHRSYRRQQIAASWSVPASADKVFRVHGVKISGQGLISDYLNVSASVRLLEGVRVFT